MESQQLNVDVWLRMYEEQIRHVRHHESLRTQSTSMILVLSAALLAFLSSEIAPQGKQYIPGLFIVLLNIYGALISLKHYERSKLHRAVSEQYRNAISDVAALENLKLNEVRGNGKLKHRENFPGGLRWIFDIRAYVLWTILHLILVAVGVIFSLV